MSIVQVRVGLSRVMVAFLSGKGIRNHGYRRMAGLGVRRIMLRSENPMC